MEDDITRPTSPRTARDETSRRRSAAQADRTAPLAARPVPRSRPSLGLYARLSADGPDRSRSCGRRPFGARARRRPSGSGRPEPAPPAGGRDANRRRRADRRPFAGDGGAAACVRRARVSPRDEPGRGPARHSTSSTSRLPSPATRCWSMSRAFSGAVLRSSAAASCAGVIDAGVDAEAGLVRVQLDAAEPARVVDAQDRRRRRTEP